MVPASMIPNIADEIKHLLQSLNFRVKDESGAYRVPNVFEHAIPPKGRNSENTNIPWVLVSLYNGEQPSPTDPRSVTVHITCMLYDDNEDMQGFLDAMNLLEHISQHLYSKTIIGGRYEIVYPYQFAVLDDVRYPYFSAGLAIRVQLQGTTPQNTIGEYSYV